MSCRAEVSFDEEAVRYVKFKEYDAPVLGLSIDSEAYLKFSDRVDLYQFSLWVDDFDMSAIPASFSAVFRESYLRAKLDLERDDRELTVQGVWKESAFDEGKIILDRDYRDWSFKEVLVFDPPSSIVRPEKGTLTVERELCDVLSAKVDVHHSLLPMRVEVDEMVLSLTLDSDQVDIRWRSEFERSGFFFTLGDYDINVSGGLDLGNLSLDAGLKVDEDGFYSMSTKVSFSFSE